MKFDPRLPDKGINVSHDRPIREALLLIAGVTGALAVLIIVLSFTIDRLVPFVPPSVETWMFSAFKPSDSIDPSDARVDRVQDIVDRLAIGWPDCPYEFDVMIIDTGQVNAFAFPGGVIGITTGLLESAESENEVAFVLGHEIGHFRARDHLRGLGRGLIISLVASGSGAHSLIQAAPLIAARSFDRNQERQADAYGLELVERMYGHVRGAGDFFSTLDEFQPDTKKRHLATYLSTHPGHAERSEALEDLALENGWSADGELEPGEF